MRINSDESLKRAEQTFERFNGDWTAVHAAGRYEDGILVIRENRAEAPKQANGSS